jgi:hypothetical protein
VIVIHQGCVREGEAKRKASNVKVTYRFPGGLLDPEIGKSSAADLGDQVHGVS